MSAAPSTTSTASDSQKLCDIPNTIVATPNTATPMNIARPACREIGRTASQPAVAAAPTPGAARSQPMPTTPTCSTSAAIAGKSAVAPPNSTANRSIEIAPRIASRRHTNLRPSITLRQLAASGATLAGGERTSARHPTESPSSTATTPNTTAGPVAAYSTPPIAGPAIVATCQAEELIATALPNSAGGTRFGRIALLAGAMNARAIPNTIITPNTGAGDRSPSAANAASATAHSIVTARQARMMLRRLKRSATCPAISTKATNGRNCDRPMSPRSRGSRVSA